MKIKTSELIGPALDWAVGKAEGLTPTLHKNPYGYWVMPNLPGSYSTDWSQGGPIIERERITVSSRHDGWWRAWLYTIDDEPHTYVIGPTPLISAMRCLVFSKLGDEVEIPEELK